MDKKVPCLGDQVIDTVSGYEGIVVSRCEYLNGCVRLSVQGKVNMDNVIPSYESFDEAQLKVVKKDVLGRSKELGLNDITGGPEVYRDKIPDHAR